MRVRLPDVALPPLPELPQEHPAHMLARAQNAITGARALEREAVAAALGATGGNVRQAAELLGMPHTTLVRLVREGGRLSKLAAKTSRRIGRPASK